MREECNLYKTAYRVVALLVMAYDIIATSVAILLTYKYLEGAARIALTVIILSTSVLAGYKVFEWLLSRATIISRLEELCGGCPVIHRLGREACCHVRGSCICVDLVYGVARMTLINEIINVYRIKPWSPLNFYGATPLEDGRVLTLSCRERDALVEARGSVERVDLNELIKG